MKESLDQAEIGSQTALSFLRGVMQRPRHGSHDIHGDGPGVVADKGDLAVALVGRAVNCYSMLPGLASKAADLVSGGWREAAANVLVEEHLHAVALDKEGVVVISPLALHPALAGLMVEGPVSWAAARRAAQVVDAALLLRVAKEAFMPHLCSRPAIDTAAACAPTLLEGAKALDLVAHVLAAVARADLCDVHDVAVVEVIELLGLGAV